MKSNQVNSSDVTLGMLSTMTVILLVTFVWLSAGTDFAMADGMTVSGGDYVITVGQVSITDEEFIYVLDMPTQRIIAYHFNNNKREIEIVQGIDFAQIREAANRASNQNNRGRSGRGRRP